MQAATSFAESLAPLARRMREQHPSIRLVSQVAFEIQGEDAFAGAIRESVAWMRNRSPSIPRSAFDGSPFLVAGGGAHAAEAVRVDREGSQLWAAVLDDPDRSVPRRTWVTELSVGKRGDLVAFGARLLNVTRGEDVPFDPSRPGIVRQLLDEHIVVADRRRLRDAPDFIESTDDVESFIDLLTDKSRRLPIIAISRTEAGVEAIDPDRIAAAVSGVAHVFVLNEDASWQLTSELGRSLSVFLGAARIYNPGLSSQTSNPFDHPLWLVRDATDREAAEIRLRQITSRVVAQSVRTTESVAKFPRFEEIKQIAAFDKREEARANAHSEKELIELLEADNKALQSQLDAEKMQQADALALSTEMLEIAESERDEARSEAFALRMRVQALEATFKSRGVALQVESLKSYEDIGDWTKRYLSGHIWIAPKAIRETEKNGAFDNITHFQDALLLLRDYFVPMKRDPSTERYGAYQAHLKELHLEDEKCFARDGDIEGFPEYAVTYVSKKYWCNNHVKFGGGYDPRYMFRIYYHWHNDDQILLIGHMPTHLDNRVTT